MFKRLMTLVFLGGISSAAMAGGLYDQLLPTHLNKTTTRDSEMFGNTFTEGTVNADITGLGSWDEQGDSSNDTLSIDVAALAGMPAGTPMTVNSFGWDVTLEVLGLSWFSESVIALGDDAGAPTLFLQPGEGDDFDSTTPMNYSSNGLVNLASAGLSDLVLSDGVVEIEFYELFDDNPDARDASYLATSTLSFGLPGVPSGDFNGDGDYACDDVDSLVMAIAAGGNDPNFDLTGDGLVNFGDLEAWLAEAGAAELPSGNPYLPADANLDGTVDAVDFTVWNDNKFMPSDGFCSGDFNADGVTDAIDFTIWNDNKFTTADGVQAVPEPASAVMWIVAMIGLAVARRR